MPFVFIALSILFTVYGICVMMLNSGSRFFMVWLGLAAYMVILAFSGRFPPMLRKVLLGFFIAFAAFVGVTWGCIFTAFKSVGEPGLKYIIVLGAQVRSNGPSTVLRYRLETACDYLEANPETECIVSGGQGYNEPEAEAVAMKEYLGQKGIAPERIMVEPRSSNTVQNLINSGEMIDLSDSTGILTNNFHVFRAVHIAEKCGYKRVCGIATSSNAFYLPNNMLRESFGIVKDLMAGNM